MIQPRRLTAAAALASIIAAAPVAAQHDMPAMPTGGPVALGGGASVIAVATQVDPGVRHRRLREGYLTQPMLFGHGAALGGALRLQGMLDFEGTTLERGELAPGAWGEGYADRRHPHTLLHELVLVIATPERRAFAASVTGGKGFVPYGTDDPMVRPIERFPVNHHLSQLLERAVLIGAVRWRGLSLDGGVFNGDEPESPGDAPDASNFADSWARRATLRPIEGLELQASEARVLSPESPSGHGVDHRQRSASLRVERTNRLGIVYALAEWADTDLLKGGREAGHLESALLEGSLTRGRVLVAARYERTIRPEEERLANPFRTPYPTADVQLLGLTRFHILTAAISGSWRGWGVGVSPFAEGSLVSARAIATPAAFVPGEFYGRPRITVLSIGVRLAAGMPHDRVGRYGAAAARGAS